MASGDDGVRTRPEVEMQLERILAAKCFKTAKTHRRLLGYVIRKYFANEEVTENKIGYALFEGYEPDKTDIVRVTATQLRKRLSQYFEKEGADDLIRIELPPGPEYKPSFSYNLRSPSYRQYSLALDALSQTRLGDAMQYLTNALKLRPSFAEAHLAWADLDLLRPLCPSYFQILDGCRLVLLNKCPGTHVLDPARDSLAAALRLNRRLYRAHILAGVVHCYVYDWDEAERRFERALKISELDTQSDRWYLWYLVARNRFDEVVPLLEARLKASPSNAGALTQYGFTMYVLREYKEAHRAFDDAWTIDQYCWPALVGDACVALSTQGPHAALKALGDLLPWFVEGKFFPGLLVLCLGRLGRISEAREHIARFEPYSMSNIDRALACIGLDMPERAVEALSQACENYDPLMLWAHQWPFLDSLRERADFRALLQRMGLFQSARDVRLS